MGMATIGDYKNVVACGIFTHHFDVAEIRICDSNTPPTLGIVGQILPRRSPRVAPTGVATSGWEVDVSPNTERSFFTHASRFLHRLRHRDIPICLSPCKSMHACNFKPFSFASVKCAPPFTQTQTQRYPYLSESA